MGRFDGRVVLVTGSASGIGQATATRFAEDGATVVCADMNESKGRRQRPRRSRSAGGATSAHSM